MEKETDSIVDLDGMTVKKPFAKIHWMVDTI